MGWDVLQSQVGRCPAGLNRRDVCPNDLAVGKLVGKVNSPDAETRADVKGSGEGSAIQRGPVQLLAVQQEADVREQVHRIHVLLVVGRPVFGVAAL